MLCYLGGGRDGFPGRNQGRGFSGKDLITRVSVGKATGDDSTNIPALVWRQVAVSLGLGNIFMRGN